MYRKFELGIDKPNHEVARKRNGDQKINVVIKTSAITVKYGIMSFRIRLIVPILLILAAVFLRLYRLPEFTMFLGDQGRDAIIVKRIITFEHFPAIGAPSSLGQIFLGPFFYYLIAPFLLISHFNPIGPVFGVAIISIIGIAVSYLIVKKEVNILAALFFLILTTFSFVNIEFSRFSWNPNLVPIFSFMTLYFFYKFVATKNYWFSLAFGTFWAFTIQLHYLSLFLGAPILFFIIIETSKKKHLDKYFTGALIAFLSFIIISVPLFIFDLRHQFLNTKNFIKLFTDANLVSNSSLLSRLLETNQLFYMHALHLSLNEWLVFLFTFFLILIFVKKFLASKYLLLQINFFNFVFYLLSFSFLNSSRLSHYYNSIYFSFYLILAFLFYQLAKKNRILNILVLVVLFFYAFINTKDLYFFSINPENQIKKAERIADAILQSHPQLPYQTIALPNVETDGHIRYFLEIKGERPLPADTLEQPKELYILCFAKCQVLGNAQWQIAAFKQAKIATMWTTEGVTIYKVIHGQ